MIHYISTPKDDTKELKLNKDQANSIVDLKIGTNNSTHLKSKSENIDKKIEIEPESPYKLLKVSEGDQIIRNLNDCSEIVDIMSQKIVKLRS